MNNSQIMNVVDADKRYNSRLDIHLSNDVHSRRKSFYALGVDM